jgi:hypothetical protein
VNAIAPVAATRLTATVPQRARQIRLERGVSTAAPTSDLPQPRMEPADIAPFVVFLATDGASNINGQTFLVKGGMISLLNYPAPARTITKHSRWTAEEIAMLFPSTFGMDLVNPAPAKD